MSTELTALGMGVSSVTSLGGQGQCTTTNTVDATCGGGIIPATPDTTTVSPPATPGAAPSPSDSSDAFSTSAFSLLSVAVLALPVVSMF